MAKISRLSQGMQPCAASRRFGCSAVPERVSKKIDAKMRSGARPLPNNLFDIYGRHFALQRGNVGGGCRVDDCSAQGDELSYVSREYLQIAR